jgi:hypothetical protein
MRAIERNQYAEYPDPQLVAEAHFALIERERRRREEAARHEALKLEDVLLHQPNDFAD